MKNYSIEIKESIEKPKIREQPNKSSDSFLLPLFLAIVVGIWVSPDLIDIRDYIPKDKYGNDHQLDFNFLLKR